MSTGRSVDTGKGAKALFVAGTDTSVGKTMVCSLLLGVFLDSGFRSSCQKWVSTGSENPDDLLYCLRRNRLSAGSTILNTLAPYRFKMAASPHLAAEAEGREIDPDVLLTSLEKAGADNDILLLEGVGGLHVPLTRELLLVDLVARLDLPVILVARSGLGTLNHTLMSIESLKNRGLSLLGIIFSDEQDYAADDLLVNDNIKTIGEMTGSRILGRLPRCREYPDAVRAFRPIGEKLLAVLQSQGVEND